MRGCNCAMSNTADPLMIDAQATINQSMSQLCPPSTTFKQDIHVAFALYQSCGMNTGSGS